MENEARHVLPAPRRTLEARVVALGSPEDTYNSKQSNKTYFRVVERLACPFEHILGNLDAVNIVFHVHCFKAETIVFILGMWKGLTPRIIMIGTLTALQWFIYDSVKVYFRMPRPPPPDMPESLKRKLEQQNQ